jgi:DNA repair exonuclease SbcCD nuclease subunit
VIVAHLADLHLGFRAYGRVERGADVRERDVAAAFERASMEIVRLRPDVVVIAGDVFDRPDPPASAVVALARGLEVFRASLPGVPVLMVAGPRDTPRREGDPGALAVFDTFPNVEAATGLPRSILIERLGLHAALLPHRSVTRDPPAVPEPDPRMQWNLLVVHAQESVRDARGPQLIWQISSVKFLSPLTPGESVIVMHELQPDGAARFDIMAGDRHIVTGNLVNIDMSGVEIPNTGP